MTPQDPLVFIGPPPLLRPEADEVHVSVLFTWDVERARELQAAWAQYYPRVLIGGPALKSLAGPFTPGLYVRRGITFTTRGCNNRCPWCLVPTHEGRLRTIPIVPGHTVQDNNLLQAPREHQEAVFEMCRRQDEPINFGGGFEAALVDEWVAEQLRTIRIRFLWLACDTPGAMRPLRRALERLNFLRRDQLRCFVLIGRNETITEARQRLVDVWNAGALPFAQLFQPPEDERRIYSPEWRALLHQWSRPAIMRRLMTGPKPTEQGELFR